MGAGGAVNHAADTVTTQMNHKGHKEHKELFVIFVSFVVRRFPASSR